MIYASLHGGIIVTDCAFERSSQPLGGSTTMFEKIREFLSFVPETIAEVLSLNAPIADLALIGLVLMGIFSIAFAGFCLVSGINPFHEVGEYAHNFYGRRRVRRYERKRRRESSLLPRLRWWHRKPLLPSGRTFRPM